MVLQKKDNSDLFLHNEPLFSQARLQESFAQYDR